MQTFPGQVELSDHEVRMAAGALSARRWRPDGAAEDAPMLLMFHDSLGCVELWRNFPADLAAATGLAVVAYDRLGFGRSEPCLGRLDCGFIAEEARSSVPALLDQLGVDRFIAFGHSVGGAMAVHAGAAYPDRCAGVITLSAQAFVEDRTLQAIRDARLQFQDPDQMARLARYHGAKAPWVLDAWIGTWLSPQFADWTMDDALQTLRRPLLAIHGDRDEYGSRAHPQRIVAKAGGGAELLLVEDCGHVPHRERPDIVLHAVRQFVLG